MRDDTQQAPNCPVCGFACEARPLSEYSAKRAALHFCPPWRNPERHQRLLACIEGLWPDGKAEVRHCSECGFGFGHPFVGGNEAFYRILHEEMGYPSWRWDYDAALAHPQIAGLKGGRALDLGAGTGIFLQSLGDDWEKHAVESTELTRAELQGKGIAVHASLEASALRSLRGTFDLITMFQVLEHVADFYPLLSACRDLLKPGGAIFISVPDGDAMLEQERLTGCPDMPPNHINRWSPSSLALALQQVGMKPGLALSEPASWGKVGQKLYLSVVADAARPHTLAAQIYRIRQRWLRTPLLQMAGGVAALKLVRHAPRLRLGDAFAIAATAEPSAGE
jgi:SAM-dependent methyltransferase